MARKKKLSRAKRLSKSVGNSPTWLKTVIIAKPGYGSRTRGTFGAASEVVRIDPATGLPMGEIAPSQMAVGAEISGSFMRARYGAGTAQGDSLKVANGSAFNHDHTNRVVNVPVAGA